MVAADAMIATVAATATVEDVTTATAVLAMTAVEATAAVVTTERGRLVARLLTGAATVPSLLAAHLPLPATTMTAVVTTRCLLRVRRQRSGHQVLTNRRFGIWLA